LEAQGKKQVAAFDEMFRQLGKMPDFKVPEKEEEEGRRRKKKEEGRRKKEEENWTKIDDFLLTQYFKNGISSLTFLKAWEYEDILFYIPHVLHNLNVEAKIIQVSISIIEVLIELRKPEFTVSF